MHLPGMQSAVLGVEQPSSRLCRRTALLKKEEEWLCHLTQVIPRYKWQLRCSL